MNELQELTTDELRMYKYHLVGELKELQRKTREIDKIISRRCKGE